MSRIFFGEYCRHKDGKGPCLEETNSTCDLCKRPMCSKHRKLSKNTGDKRVCLDCVYTTLFASIGSDSK